MVYLSSYWPFSRFPAGEWRKKVAQGHQTPRGSTDHTAVPILILQ